MTQQPNIASVRWSYAARGERPVYLGAVLAGALLWSGGAFAHCDPANGHFECPPPEPSTPADPVPGDKDILVGNKLSRQVAAGAGGIKVTADVVNQRYSNNARQWYLLLDATVPLPYARLGINDKTQAQQVQPVLRYFHADQTTPYAECHLEARTVKSKAVVYSLGLKSNAAETLLRWGHCDNAQLAGFDSLFPPAMSGDKAILVGADGKAIAEFEPPILVDVPLPPKLKKQPQPGTAKLLETNAAYKIKK